MLVGNPITEPISNGETLSVNGFDIFLEAGSTRDDIINTVNDFTFQTNVFAFELADHPYFCQPMISELIQQLSSFQPEPRQDSTRTSTWMLVQISKGSSVAYLQSEREIFWMPMIFSWKSDRHLHFCQLP